MSLNHLESCLPQTPPCQAGKHALASLKMSLLASSLDRECTTTLHPFSKGPVTALHCQACTASVLRRPACPQAARQAWLSSPDMICAAKQRQATKAGRRGSHPNPVALACYLRVSLRCAPNPITFAKSSCISASCASVWLPATMAISVLPLIALVLATLHVCHAASAGPELTGKPGAPDQGACDRACAHREWITRWCLCLSACLCPTWAVNDHLCQAVSWLCAYLLLPINAQRSRAGRKLKCVGGLCQVINTWHGDSTTQHLDQRTPHTSTQQTKPKPAPRPPPKPPGECRGSSRSALSASAPCWRP